MNRLWKIIYRVISVILILGILANLWLGLSPKLFDNRFPTIFGYALLQVETGSMSPSIHTGDAIIIHRVETYQTDDIITFYQEERYITHRILNIDSTGMTSKGDANNAADGKKVQQDEIYGKVTHVIPKGGILLRAVHDPLVISGTALTVCLLWLLLRVAKKPKHGVKHEKEKA